MYTPTVFRVPPGGANLIGVGLHIKLPPRTEMVFKTRFKCRGLTVGNPGYKSNKELTLLTTASVSRGCPEEHALPKPNIQITIARL